MEMKKLDSFKEPKILCTLEAYRKMRNYVSIHDKEIGWFGTVEKVNDIYVITDVILPKQEVTSTYNEIDTETLIALASELTSEQITKLRCYGHSHVDMTVSPSGTDKEQVEELTEGSEWFITVINNKDDDWHIAFNDYKRGLQFITRELEFFIPTDKNIEKEIKDKVQTRVAKVTTNTTKGWQNNQGYNAYWGYDMMRYPRQNYTKQIEEKTVKEEKEEEETVSDYNILNSLIESYLMYVDEPDSGEAVYRAVVDKAKDMYDCTDCPYESDGKCTVLETSGAMTKYGIDERLCPDLLTEDSMEFMYDSEDEELMLYWLEEFIMDKYIGGAVT